MKKFLLALPLLGCALTGSSQTASFQIQYNGFTPQAQAAVQHAADQWAGILVSAVPIKINAYFFPMPAGSLGITLPNGRKDFTGVPQNGTWYPTSLANAMTGIELNPGEYDMDLFLSSTVNWHYSTSGAVPAGQYDLVSVAMHEIGHGLGFVSLAKKSGTEGSIGMLLASDFAPIVTSFPWPDQQGLPGIFDRFIETNSGQSLLSFSNPGTDLGNAITGNNLFFNGTHALAANNGVRPRIYAPPTFELGSSVSHLNEATYPVGNPNEMMTPQGSPGQANHHPGPIALGILRDIGWNLNPELSAPGAAGARQITLVPNPAMQFVRITGLHSHETTVRCLDATGRVVTQAALPGNGLVDVSMLAPGCYVLQVESPNRVTSTVFVVQR